MSGAVERGVSTKVSNSAEDSTCSAFTMVSGVDANKLVSGVVAWEGVCADVLLLSPDS